MCFWNKGRADLTTSKNVISERLRNSMRTHLEVEGTYIERKMGEGRFYCLDANIRFIMGGELSAPRFGCDLHRYNPNH